MDALTERTLPSPFAITTPPGAEGWESLYPYYHMFSEERRGFEEGKFWFTDKIHHAEPMYPFDAIMCEVHWIGLSQYNTRIFLVPSALGMDQRILNGYLYMSPNTIDEPAEVARRSAIFRERAGYYFDNWDRLYEQWQVKAQAHIEVLAAIEVRSLPEMEADSVVIEGKGLSSGYALLEAYNRVIESLFKIWQYHFEMLNLGYFAYLTFLDFCREAFPGIPDQSVAKMVSGIDVLLFRPDDELRALARLGVKLGLQAALLRERAPEALIAALESSGAGRTWLARLEQAKRPWFNFSTGNGLYHHDRSWIDDLSLPFAALRDYVVRLDRGEDIDRPVDTIRETRDRITEEYLSFLDGEESRKTFIDLLELSRRVFPYVENHNFFVEHWHHTVFWNKIRDFGKIFQECGFIAVAEDIFFLNRFEIEAALFDLVTAWAVGTPARGPGVWPAEIERRKAIHASLRAWRPPSGLGTPPQRITDPFLIMLWGIDDAVVRDWTGGAAATNPGEVKGCAAAPGLVEGVARVIHSANQLAELQPGEILICPVTTPSWAPVFSRIGAAVSDSGGIMSHAAIVAREYGLPAVVGTANGTERIRTGQRVRVDGNTGVVIVLP
ncbi:PEP-utilizing enzyme [soil metagenome]